MLGLITPTKGKASVMGKSPRDISLKSKIGFMPEESYLYRFLNASETLCLYGQLLGLKGKELNNRIDRVLNIVGLDRVRSQPLREYSKGMSRRMGLAQVLLKEPELCILDEPTIGLDPIGAGEIKDIIRELKKQGTTILFSTHILSEAEPICDRIGILHSGKLITMGSLDDLLEVRDEVVVRKRETLEEFYIRTFSVIPRLDRGI